MNYNYQQQPAQQQINNNQPRNFQPTSWNSKVRPVSSIEEVRACPIDFDGSVFYFPDAGNKRIYTKWINPDGTAGLAMYELKEIPVQSNNNIIENYITREEFEEAINQVKTAIASISHPQPEPVKNPIMQF